MATFSLFIDSLDTAAGNRQLLQLEEKDVIQSVATVLSDLCKPGERVPMVKLHAKVGEIFLLFIFILW